MANQRDAFALSRPVSRQLYKRLLDAMNPLGHLQVKLATEKDIDGVLLGWLRDAYDLCP
jgi:hypothetical protein